MSNLKYISILKPEGSSKDWEARLITACRNNKVNCERRMTKKGRKTVYVYDLSCSKESFEAVVKEMRDVDESKTDS